jgi:anti-anti-sigma regulatory factor
MFDAVVENSGNGGILRLKGSLVFQHVGELKPVMLGILETSEHLIVNIDDVTEIDLSCIQLFCSLHKAALKRGKGLALFAKRNDLFKDLIANAGYLRHIGCSLDIQSNAYGWEVSMSKCIMTVDD